MKPSGRSLRRLVDLLDDLVDERVGIVRTVYEVRREPGGPRFFHYAARACDTRAFTDQRNFAETGGASADRGIAIAKAVGEAVERYCGAVFDVEELPLHAAADAPFACVDPASFALYSEEQYDSPGFPWVRFDADTPVRWTPAVDLRTGAGVHVPAAFVWIPYFFYRGSGDSPIVQPISTGLACHCSRAEAALSALGEVVERDAFTLMWQARLSMPQIRVETLSDANYDLVQRHEAVGDSVTLLNITNDVGIPTVLSVLRSQAPERPALVYAASSDLSPEVATRKALEELAHTLRYSQRIASKLPRIPRDDADGPAAEHVLEQVDHLNFYCDHANAGLADFTFASKERIEFDEMTDASTGSPEADLEIVVDRITRCGHRALLADLTTDDVRSLGLHVVRAVVPGFHPLFMGFRLRALGGRRLWEVPAKLGYPQIARGADNPAPHPYP